MPPEKSVVSYADTTVGAVFFNVRLPATGETRQRIVDSYQSFLNAPDNLAARQQYAVQLGNFVNTYCGSIFQHEWCHILQAISYPGLYLRSLHEFFSVSQILSCLRQDPAPEKPVRLFLSQEWMETWTIPTIPYRITIEEGGARKAFANPGEIGLNILTEADLLEEDASVYQYRSEIGAIGTGGGYSRWLKEKARYTMTFALLRRVFNVEDAFLALSPLVRAAYSTTWPMTTFVALLNMVLRERPKTPSFLGIDGYYQLLIESLEDSQGISRKIPHAYDPAPHDPYSLLDRQGFRVLIDEFQEHPLQPLARDLWEKPLQTASGRDGLFHPYELWDRRKQETPKELEPYWPPLTVMRATDLDVGSAAVLTPERFGGKPCPFLPEMSYEEYFLESVKRKSLALLLVSDFYRGTPHYCVHNACPLHSVNLCRRWPDIPDHFENCKFPGWMEIATHHRVDSGTRTLQPTRSKREVKDGFTDRGVSRGPQSPAPHAGG